MTPISILARICEAWADNLELSTASDAAKAEVALICLRSVAEILADMEPTEETTVKVDAEPNQGWCNHATWHACLDIANDEKLYQAALKILAEFPDKQHAAIVFSWWYMAVQGDEYSPDINWAEIVEHMRDGL